jgi:phenylalanyl-tRNA synthetase alpha chain
MTDPALNAATAATPNLTQLIDDARQTFAAAIDLPSLENEKARFLGKTGALTELLKGLGKMSPEQKKTEGAAINVAKQTIETLLRERREALENVKLMAQLHAEALDVTLPGRGHQRGSLHPLTLTIQRIETIFRSIGFDVADGPEIEDDFYNFTALNTPENHPARSMHDTFYVENDLLLRTHTSPMQIRYARMHKDQLPIKVIAPGRVYRVDSDATHSPMFHQLEGLWVGREINFAHLKGVVIEFLQRFFETTDLRVRFRPSFFPFTEPSAEIDMAFGEGKWLEIAGSGQVHPNVIRNIGLDPEEFIGFAFGMGIDRLAMLRYGIQDLRLFYENDTRFLRQFA